MRLIAAVVLLAVAGGTARANDDLAEAIRLEAALQYDQALAIVDRIIAAGTTTEPAQLAELHFYAGRLAAGLDRADAARDHFARALALHPELALPAGLSPKITAPFDAARATAAPLRLHASREGDHVVAIVDSDTLGLAHTLVPGRDDAKALDNHGNVVWHGEAPAPPPPPPQLPTQPSFAGRASTWAVAAGGALVIGGLCAWRFQVAQDDWNRFSQDNLHDYTQLRAVEARGEHWGLAADISFGVAAAAGVTAAILYVAHRPEPFVVGPHYVGVAARF